MAADNFLVALARFDAKREEFFGDDRTTTDAYPTIPEMKEICEQLSICLTRLGEANDYEA